MPFSIDENRIGNRSDDCIQLTKWTAQSRSEKIRSLPGMLYQQRMEHYEYSRLFLHRWLA